MAAYGVTRVNGFADYTTDRSAGYVSVAQLAVYKLTIKDTSAAIDLRTLDDGATPELVELVVREVQPLMYDAVDSNAGIIYVVVDGHANSADSLTTRIKNVVIGAGDYGTLSTNISTAELCKSFSGTTSAA